MLATFLHSIGSILTILIMVMIGWVMTHAGWLDKKNKRNILKDNTECCSAMLYVLESYHEF